MESTPAVPIVTYKITNATSESKEYIENELKSLTKGNKKFKKDIKSLQQTSRRLNKRISKLENFINSYRQNHVLSDASLKIFNSIPALDNELLTLQLSAESLQVPDNHLTEESATYFSDAGTIDCSSDSTCN